MFRKQSAEGFCQQSLPSCVCSTVSIYIQFVLRNPSQQKVIQHGSPQILSNLEGAEGKKRRDWQCSRLCQYKNTADRENFTVRGGHKEVGGFEMSVRGANGKLNYTRSGVLMWWIGGAGRREFPFNLQRR